jgi:hypothetical protein
MTLLGATIRALGPAAVTKFRVERQPAEGLEIQSAGLTNERESILAYLIPSIGPHLYLDLPTHLHICECMCLLAAASSISDFRLSPRMQGIFVAAHLVTVSLHLLMEHNTLKMECRLAMDIT